MTNSELTLCYGNWESVYENQVMTLAIDNKSVCLEIFQNSERKYSKSWSFDGHFFGEYLGFADTNFQKFIRCVDNEKLIFGESNVPVSMGVNLGDRKEWTFLRVKIAPSV